MWTPIKKISCFIFISILTILLIFYLERIISIYYRKVSNLSLFSISEPSKTPIIQFVGFPLLKPTGIGSEGLDLCHKEPAKGKKCS